ncbi:hypothetical protein V6Z12_A09G002400 [Gossypium hirsutum]
MRQEVAKLLSTGFIKEVEYPDWVSIVAMVKKANDKWRMYIVFTNLNNACPKGKNSFHHRGRTFLLLNHAFWSQECESNLSDVGK